MPSTASEEVAPELTEVATPDGDTTSLLLVPAETGCDVVDPELDGPSPVLPSTVADLILLLVANRFRGMEASLPDPSSLVEAGVAADDDPLDADFATPLLALDGAGR